MLTYNELRLGCLILKIACSACYIPFEFSYDKITMNFNFQVTTKRYKIVIFHTLVLLTFLNFSFNFIRIVEYYWSKSYRNHLGEFVLTFYFLLVRGINVWLSYFSIVKKDELATFLNYQNRLNNVTGACLLLLTLFVDIQVVTFK